MGAAVLAGLFFIVPFQNCGKLSALKSSESSSHSAAHIMRTSSVESPNTDITFRVHDESLPASVQYEWSYALDGAASGCTPKSASNASTFVLNCASAGKLKVTVTITGNGEPQILAYDTILQGTMNGQEIPMEIVFEIPNGAGNNSWNSVATRVETFVGQKLKLKNMDSGTHQLHTGGRPCPHGNAIAPGATVDCVIGQAFDRSTNGPVYDHLDGPSAEFHVVAYNGATLYANNCAGCHGPLATSERLNAKVSQILTARASVPAMVAVPALQTLTRRQIEAISYALGGR